MHQNTFAAGAAGCAYSASPDPLGVFLGRGEDGRERSGREMKERRGDGRGGEERSDPLANILATALYEVTAAVSSTILVRVLRLQADNCPKYLRFSF